MRVTGQITIVFTDETPTDHTLFATVNVSLNFSVAILEKASADQYGQREYLPGIATWSASGAYNEVVDSVGARDATHEALETLALERTVFAVVFTSPTGNTYTGLAWLSSYALASADQSVFKAQCSFTGLGELVLVQNI